MKRVPVLALLLLLVCGAATALAAAKLSAPSSARVGDSITARGAGLKQARYVLRLSLDNTAGPHIACVAQIGKRRDSVKGKVTIKGKIPARLTCYENDSVRLGKIAVKPGKYHLILGHADGPSGFGKGSFLRRKLTIRKG